MPLSIYFIETTTAAYVIPTLTTEVKSRSYAATSNCLELAKLLFCEDFKILLDTL